MPANARSHAVLTTESKVTIRGQTTIPAPVREALKLKPGQDSIHYEILPGGQECDQWFSEKQDIPRRLKLVHRKGFLCARAICFLNDMHRIGLSQ